MAFDKQAWMRVYKREWNKRNPEKRRAYDRIRRARYPNAAKSRMARLLERQPNYYHERWKRESEMLTDDYIKRVLCAHSRLGFRDIPKILIEAKRAELKLRRALKHGEYRKT